MQRATRRGRASGIQKERAAACSAAVGTRSDRQTKEARAPLQIESPQAPGPLSRHDAAKPPTAAAKPPPPEPGFRSGGSSGRAPLPSALPCKTFPFVSQGESTISLFKQRKKKKAAAEGKPQSRFLLFGARKEGGAPHYTQRGRLAFCIRFALCRVARSEVSQKQEIAEKHVSRVYRGWRQLR